MFCGMKTLKKNITDPNLLELLLLFYQIGQRGKFQTKYSFSEIDRGKC